MNAKILILALCAFQLAAGQLGFLSGPLSVLTAPLSAILGGAQNQAGSAQLQFSDLFQGFYNNLTSQIGFGLDGFDFLNGNNGTEACRANLTRQYYAIGNETLALFLSSISVLNQTIWNSSQVIANASRSIGNAIPQLISNFSTCISSQRGLFSFLTAIPTCGARLGAQGFTAFANTTSTSIQGAQKILSQLMSSSSINSSVHTLTQMANLGVDLSARASTDLAAAGAQAVACAAQILNATVEVFSG